MNDPTCIGVLNDEKTNLSLTNCVELQNDNP